MTTAAWQKGRVESGGEEIYFEVFGAGDGAETVMLTHGAGGNHAVWFQQLPLLTDAGYRVVTWDTRGFGNSTFRSGVHGTDAAVADMRAVLDATGTERVHLVGQSMGGWWVVAFTLAERERVLSLTLCNTVGGLWTDALDAHFRSQKVAIDDVIGRHPALGPNTDPARAFLYEELNTFHSPPMADVIVALVTTRVAHADLDACNVPTLVITGSEDALFPAQLTLDTARRLRDAQTVEIAGAGHSAYFEDPDSFTTALLSFLRGISSQ